MKKPTRTPLSEEQLADAKRLQDIYNQRVRESRDKGGPVLTQTEIGERCEWKSPQSTVSQYMTGKVALNLEALVKLADALDFEPDEISPSLAAGVTRTKPAEDGETLDHRYVLIPKYTINPLAGQNREPLCLEQDSSLAFKRHWLQLKHAEPSDLMVVHAIGNSMKPTISEGDIMLVDRSRIEPVNNGLFLLSDQNGVTVKRLRSTKEGWITASDNPGKTKQSSGESDSVLLQSKLVGQIIWRGGEL